MGSKTIYIFWTLKYLSFWFFKNKYKQKVQEFKRHIVLRDSELVPFPLTFFKLREYMKLPTLHNVNKRKWYFLRADFLIYKYIRLSTYSDIRVLRTLLETLSFCYLAVQTSIVIAFLLVFSFSSGLSSVLLSAPITQL